MKLIARFQRWMYDRYGIDDLYHFLLWIYIILAVIQLFFPNKILLILGFLLLLIMFYRVFSKNIFQRSKENQKYISWKKKVLKPFSTINRNLKDKDHIYKKCPNCKTILKLPLPTKRGIHYAKCPKCKKKVTLLALKKLKIEFIKNKK